jgi:ABC-type Fe3+/spermidine/putrescine transport system ATPase subunit
VPEPTGAAPVTHTESLRIEHVTKRFGAVKAVDDVSFEVPRGAFATLLGPSGCGKTTTLRTIAGFYDPDSGDIRIGTRRVNDLPAHRRGTAMVFQDYALFPHMTVRQNVGYGLGVQGVAAAERARRVDETLEFVGLAGLGDRWPSQLSGGQQQRVAVARALVVRPEILLLDEPLSNLDAKLREQLRWELRELQQRLRMTFVYVTHDQDEALSLSDVVVVMKEGRVEQIGEPWEIYYRPRTSYVADFIGTVNLVPATVAEVREASAAVTFAGQRVDVRIPDGLSLSPGAGVRLCIRPEALTLRRLGVPAEGVVVAGTVARSAFLGDLMRYWVVVDGREWIVDQQDPGAASPFEGPVGVTVRPERVHLIAEGS